MNEMRWKGNTGRQVKKERDEKYKNKGRIGCRKRRGMK